METVKEKPQFSKHLFWDIDVNDLDMEQHKVFVIQRTLEYGLWSDWVKVRNYYSMEEIAKAGLTIRTLFPQALAYLSLITNIPKTEFRCYKLSLLNPTPWNS